MDDRSASNRGLHHVPVLHTSVRELLAPQAGETVLDVTLGLGGHAVMFLEATSPTGQYIGLDADERHLAMAQERLQQYGDRARLLHANFRDLPALELPQVDILFADLGLCSAHVDDPERGFSFRFDAPLDLRFDASSGETAAQMLKRMTEEEIDTLLRRYGELTRLGRLPALLKERLPKTTGDVRSCVEEAYSYKAKEVLPQIFQALRIAVNDELGALQILLDHGPSLLRPGGRMAVISYHSLEDRPVKQQFRALTTAARDPLTGQKLAAPPFALLTPRPIRPTQEEQTHNPRARSALLRAIRRSS